MNLVWLVACAPIVTIPPATAALVSVLRGWPRRDQPLLKTYALEAKRLVWRSYQFFVPLIVIGGFLFVEWRFYLGPGPRTTITAVMTGVVLGFSIVAFAIAVYLLPVLTDTTLSVYGWLRVLPSLPPGTILATAGRVFAVWLVTLFLLQIVPALLFLGLVPVALWITHRVALKDLTTRRLIDSSSPGAAGPSE